MATHELKTWPLYFERVATGEKTFEVRKADDRNFQAGDVLHLREWNPTAFAAGAIPTAGEYTGRELEAPVLYVLAAAPGLQGIARGFVVMSLGAPSAVVGLDGGEAPARPWSFFAKGKCRSCEEFRRVNAENVCKPCHTGEPAEREAAPHD